jgi:hypothetical protein
MQKPLKEFAKLYKEKIDPNQAFSTEDIKKKYTNKNLQFINDAPKNLLLGFEMMWRDYNDKSLNKVAREASRYVIAMIVVILLNFFVISYFIVNK